MFQFLADRTAHSMATVNSYTVPRRMYALRGVNYSHVTPMQITW